MASGLSGEQPKERSDEEIRAIVERAVFDAWAVREGAEPTSDTSWWHIHRSGPTHSKWAADAAFDALSPLLADRSRLQEERDSWRRTCERITEERDAAQATIRRVEMLRCWTNEDGRGFVFADDLFSAIMAGLPVTPGASS